MTRANRVQLDSLHAGEWVRVRYAGRYGESVAGCAAYGLQACIGRVRWLVSHAVGGLCVGLVCVCALYSSTKLDVIVVAS